jgi:psiF repeat
MRFRKSLGLTALVVLIGSSAAFAQATPPAKPTDAEKKAVSKTCSDQATAKGLHGKERRAFRSECKKNGGKPA